MERQTGQRDPKIRLPWEPPRLELIGDLEEIVRGGGGKLSPLAVDPGDPRKNPGHG
jgi:hypothetical protein